MKKPRADKEFDFRFFSYIWGIIMKILALDQSTKLVGWSIFEDGNLLNYGLITADEKEKNIVNRIEQIYIQIDKKIKEEGITNFVFEDTFSSRNLKVSKVLAWMQGGIITMSFLNDYGFQIYAPNEWRSALGFKKKSKYNPQPEFKTNRDYQKWQAIDYANKNFGCNFEYGNKGDDDQAESICIGIAHYIINAN